MTVPAICDLTVLDPRDFAASLSSFVKALYAEGSLDRAPDPCMKT